jgi:hypothetical protein
MSTRVAFFGFGSTNPSLPLRAVRPTQWALQVAAFCGAPFQFHLGIGIVDCWVEGHVLELEIIGPDGRRVAPEQRTVLPRGDERDGSLNVVKYMAFCPQQPGVHAIQARLDRRWAGEVRFDVGERRWWLN